MTRTGVETVAVAVVEAAMVVVAVDGQAVVLEVEIQGEVEIMEMDWTCSVPLV